MGQRGGTHAGERAEPNRPTPTTLGNYQPAPGFKVPFSDKGQVTGGWASWGKPAPLPVNGPRFKSSGRRIPTQITHVDPRKVTL